MQVVLIYPHAAREHCGVTHGIGFEKPHQGRGLS